MLALKKDTIQCFKYNNIHSRSSLHISCFRYFYICPFCFTVQYIQVRCLPHCVYVWKKRPAMYNMWCYWSSNHMISGSVRNSSPLLSCFRRKIWHVHIWSWERCNITKNEKKFFLKHSAFHCVICALICKFACEFFLQAKQPLPTVQIYFGMDAMNNLWKSI